MTGNYVITNLYLLCDKTMVPCIHQIIILHVKSFLRGNDNAESRWFCRSYRWTSNVIRCGAASRVTSRSLQDLFSLTFKHGRSLKLWCNHRTTLRAVAYCRTIEEVISRKGLRGHLLKSLPKYLFWEDKLICWSTFVVPTHAIDVIVPLVILSIYIRKCGIENIVWDKTARMLTWNRLLDGIYRQTGALHRRLRTLLRHQIYAELSQSVDLIRRYYLKEKSSKLPETVNSSFLLGPQNYCNPAAAGPGDED